MEITLFNTKNSEIVSGTLISETQAGWVVDVENKYGGTVRWFMLVISGWQYQPSAEEMQADEEYAMGGYY